MINGCEITKDGRKFFFNLRGKTVRQGCYEVWLVAVEQKEEKSKRKKV